MAEIPGMIRPELQALPQISDRMTFIYLRSEQAGRSYHCNRRPWDSFPSFCCH